MKNGLRRISQVQHESSGLIYINNIIFLIQKNGVNGTPNNTAKGWLIMHLYELRRWSTMTSISFLNRRIKSTVEIQSTYLMTTTLVNFGSSKNINAVPPLKCCHVDCNTTFVHLLELRTGPKRPVPRPIWHLARKYAYNLYNI